MEKWINKVALVTGASSGIGAVIALSLADAGMLVVGLGRRIEKIEELSTKVTGNGKIFPKKCDITNESEVNEIFEWINENLNGIHVFISVAGIMKAGFLLEEKMDLLKDIIQTNIVAMCYILQKVVEIMKTKNIDGHIILMNSILGHRIPDVPVPLFNIYPATKYAITAISQVVKQELQFHKTAIKLTSISPGMVNTDFLNSLNTSALFKTFPKLEPEDVNAAVIYALQTPENVQVDEIILSAKQLFN